MRCILINLIELIVMLTVFTVCDRPGTIKYAVVALLSVGFMFLGRKKKWMINQLTCIVLPVAVYLGVGCLNSLMNASIYSSTLKIVLFWTIPLLFAFSLYTFYGTRMSHIADIQFVSSCLVYLITKGRFILETITVESMFAYVYGAFLIYYVYKKRWGFCCIAAFLMFLTDKRIVVLAVIIAVIVQMLLWLFRNDKRVAFGIWGVAGITINLYLWIIYSGTLEAFCKGVGINTNGRVKMYGNVTRWFGQSFFSAGNGLGIVEILLSSWNIEKFSNLHNDLLKFHIELGFFGLLLFLVSYGVVFFIMEKKCEKVQIKLFLSMAVYTMMLFATDNVSIYIIYLIPVYTIYFAVLSENHKEEITGKI